MAAASVAVVTTLTGCAATDVSTAGPASSSEAPDSTNVLASPRIQVVSSTDVYGDITRTIGGDRVTVTEIINSVGQDPHSFEASPRDQLAVEEAQLIIENGGGYDDFMRDLRSATATEAASIVAFDVTALVATDDEAEAEPASDAEGQGARGGGEHIWYDLDAMAVLAEAVAGALAGLDPASRETFESNAAAFVDALAELQSRLTAINDAHDGTTVAVTEPLPLYLIEDAGLVNGTPDEFSEAIEDGTDVPVRILAETLALLTDDQVEVLVYNEQTTGPQTEQVREAAESNDVSVVAVTETLPPGSSYLDWMGANIDALEDALR